MIATEFLVLRSSIDAESPTDSSHLSLSDVAKKLETSKRIVPEIISHHGRRKWENAIKASFPSPPLLTLPPHLKPINRAFYKMREILLSCGIRTSKSSAHLGEAPGGFVQAVSLIGDESWTWKAISMQGEGLPSPSFDLLPLNNGSFLTDLPSSCDLLNEECREEAVSRIGEGSVDLVTADGAVEMNHDNLEEDHLDLLFSQTDVALRILQKGGVYVCKFFEASEFSTLFWIALLASVFREVSVIKPTWSRPTNSERYIVAKGFEGSSFPLPRSGKVADGWFTRTRKVLDRMNEQQIAAISNVCRYLSFSPSISS